jgi:hypothetical protein
MIIKKKKSVKFGKKNNDDNNKKNNKFNYQIIKKIYIFIYDINT